MLVSTLVAGCFNYSELDPDVADAAKAAAAAIWNHRERTVAAILAIGQELIRVKDKLAHGHFLAWIKAEFEMTERTAQNYMSAAAEFGVNAKPVSYLPAATLYALASPSTPAALREEVVSRSEEGSPIPVKEVEAELWQARQKAKEAKEAEEQAKRDAALTDKQRKGRERSKANRWQEELKRREEYEARKQARLAAAKAALAWLAERGDPAEFLSLLQVSDGLASYEFVEALKNLASKADFETRVAA